MVKDSPIIKSVRQILIAPKMAVDCVRKTYLSSISSFVLQILFELSYYYDFPQLKSKQFEQFEQFKKSKKSKKSEKTKQSKQSKQSYPTTTCGKCGKFRSRKN
uniref:Uncharacterized protein n=1 Tax=Rhizophagus irregularis (strain DAOM 181602 / DAOM 197198 / MUCL 43194) TaxID=747089 RepID=U9SPJ7_RHIID